MWSIKELKARVNFPDKLILLQQILVHNLQGDQMPLL